MKWPNDEFLRQANRGMLVIIVILNAFVLGSPFWPRLNFEIAKITKPEISIKQADWLDSIDRSYNHIIIPELRLDEKIHEGESLATAHLGVWRRPNTSVPGNDNNTVMVGHRFTYDGKSVFYNLDKLIPDETIIVVWDGKVFVYLTTHQFEAPATAVEIEAPSRKERLTLYTCTPLWSAENRLVVTADLIEVSK
jgi:LPXTG-site transpeptidase (sortase) family protein